MNPLERALVLCVDEESDSGIGTLAAVVSQHNLKPKLFLWSNSAPNYACEPMTRVTN